MVKEMRRLIPNKRRNKDNGNEVTLDDIVRDMKKGDLVMDERIPREFAATMRRKRTREKDKIAAVG